MENHFKDTPSTHSVHLFTKTSRICSHVRLQCQNALRLLVSQRLGPCVFVSRSPAVQGRELTQTNTVTEIPTHTVQQFPLKMLLRILLSILESTLSLRRPRGEIFLKSKSFVPNTNCQAPPLGNWLVFLLKTF